MTEDILFFFDREPQALSLFELLCEQAMARWPSSTLRVQKTQITFSDPRGYLFASRPRRRGGSLMVSFGLSAPLQPASILQRICWMSIRSWFVISPNWMMN